MIDIAQAHPVELGEARAELHELHFLAAAGDDRGPAKGEPIRDSAGLMEERVLVLPAGAASRLSQETKVRTDRDGVP